MARLPDPMKRASLLRAAEASFLEHGFEGASLRGIAESAGIPVAGIYTYFRDKSALFEVVVSPVTEAVDTTLAGARADIPSAVTAGIDSEARSALILQIVRFAYEHRSLILLLTYRSGGSSLARWVDTVLDALVAIDIAGAKWLGATAPHRLPQRPAAWLVRAVFSMQLQSLLDWLQEGLVLRELEYRSTELTRYIMHANERYLQVPDTRSSL